MSLENNQLLLLDALVYYAELSDKELNEEEEENTERNRYITIADFIDSVKMYEKNYSTVFDKPLGYTDEELGMNKIINLIAEDEKLTRLVMIYPSRANDKTTSSICLVDPKTSEVYVIYVGNYAEEEYRYYDDDYNSTLIKTWVDNVMGAVEADTDEQKRQLDFYEDAIAAAREYLHNQDGDLDITVSGHSAGGNFAQYVAITYEEYMGDNYQAINDIDKCVSFDGQGFSTAFLEKYCDDIVKRSDKITSYCPTVSFVGALLNDIPGINQIYIDIGEPDAMLIGYHMPAELVDAEGEFKKKGVPSLEYQILKTFTSSSVAILEKLPGIDEHQAAEILGNFLKRIIDDGEFDKDDIKSIISDENSCALLIILLAEVLPSMAVTLASPEYIIATETVNEINNSIVGVQDLIEKGKLGEALEEVGESVSKIVVALKMFSMGMETGNPVIGLTCFVAGWALGDAVYKIGGTIGNTVYEIGEALGDTLFEAGTYVGEKIENTLEISYIL